MLVKITLLLVALCCFISYSLAVLGVDMSLQQCQSASLSNWQCLRNQGFEFAIIEAWNGGYQYNANIKKCVDDARAAGFKYVDVYAFMCPNCRGNNPASTAVNYMLGRLHNEGVNYGQLWVDVEQCSGCWTGTLSQNCNYVAEAIQSANSYFQNEGAGRKVGVYSSMYEWQQTVGTCSYFSQYQLWYAHYDNVPNFSDSWAYKFGGWSSPAIKQYYDHGPSQCGVDVDVNYY
ncbi:hypothetical protein ABK040_016579 [Willaertia magna]